jgi:putative lysine/arginine/ornithine/histidine/octopine transport system permease protein
MDLISSLLELAQDYWPQFLRGLWTTVQLTVLSCLLGFCLAIPLALARLSKNWLISGPALVYSVCFRGSPLLVQVFLIYYGLPSVLLQFYGGDVPAMRESFFWPLLNAPFMLALIAFTLNTGAYMAEPIRGGIQSVPNGEREAALACGMSPRLLNRRVLLPRGLRIATTLVSLVTMLDLMGAAGRAFTQTYDSKVYLVLVPFYLVLIWAIARFFALLEKRYNRYLVRKTD